MTNIYTSVYYTEYIIFQPFLNGLEIMKSVYSGEKKETSLFQLYFGSKMMIEGYEKAEEDKALAGKLFICAKTGTKAEIESAWKDICTEVVQPVLKSYTRNGISFYRIAKDRNLDELELYGMLFEDMVYYRRLEKYDGTKPLFKWMQLYLKKIILEYCKKNDNPASENENENVFIDSNNEFLEILEKSFSQLWRSNPMRAYVYQLKRYYSLSSKEIAVKLDLTTDNVDQLFNRAKKDMEKLVREMGGDVL